MTGVTMIIWLFCHFNMHMEPLHGPCRHQAKLLCRPTVCFCFFNWLFGRNFNWIPVEIHFNWIVAWLQSANELPTIRGREKKNGLALEPYNKLEQEVIQREAHTPRTKEARTHISTCVCAHKAKPWKKISKSVPHSPPPHPPHHDSLDGVDSRWQQQRCAKWLQDWRRRGPKKKRWEDKYGRGRGNYRRGGQEDVMIWKGVKRVGLGVKSGLFM